MSHELPAGSESLEAIPVTPVESEILRAVGEIRFGSIEITVHDGRVVQFERREKIRLREGAPSVDKSYPTAA